MFIFFEGLKKRVHELVTLVDYLDDENVKKLFNIKTDKVHVMGHSYGAATMMSFTQQNKERVSSCVLCK